MDKRRLMTSADVTAELGISKSQAYKIMKELNSQLQEKGFMTISGKVSRAYFEEKFFGMCEDNE